MKPTQTNNGNSKLIKSSVSSSKDEQHSMESVDPGLGHPEITRHEWFVNQQRDTYALFLGNKALLTQLALSQNKSIARCKSELLQKFLIPSGIPTKNPYYDDNDGNEENNKEKDTSKENYD